MMQLLSFNYYFKIIFFPAPQIEITHRIAWRRTFNDNYTSCNPASGGLLVTGGDLDQCTAIDNCNDVIGDTSFRCTDFSIQEDWVSGIGTNTYTLPAASDTFEAS